MYLINKYIYFPFVGRWELPLLHAWQRAVGAYWRRSGKCAFLILKFGLQKSKIWFKNCCGKRKIFSRTKFRYVFSFTKMIMHFRFNSIRQHFLTFSNSHICGLYIVTQSYMWAIHCHTVIYVSYTLSHSHICGLSQSYM